MVDGIQASGGQAIDVPTDVADEEACLAMVQSTVGAFGRLDILVNNAPMFTSVERKAFTDIPVKHSVSMAGPPCISPSELILRARVQPTLQSDH
ncbi:MAG: SDR family oxidoreductase [Acidobacteriota bacterium]